MHQPRDIKLADDVSMVSFYQSTLPLNPRKLTFYFFIHLLIKGEFNSFWFAEELSNLRDRNYSMIRFRAHAPIGMIPIIKFEKITSTDSY